MCKENFAYYNPRFRLRKVYFSAPSPCIYIFQSLEHTHIHTHTYIYTLFLNTGSLGDGICEQVMTIIRDVSSTLNGIKANVAKIEQMLGKWKKNTMFIRKEGKIYSLEELADTQKALISMRENEIKEGGVEIAKLLDASHNILKVREQ